MRKSNSLSVQAIVFTSRMSFAVRTLKSVIEICDGSRSCTRSDDQSANMIHGNVLQSIAFFHRMQNRVRICYSSQVDTLQESNASFHPEGFRHAQPLRCLTSDSLPRAKNSRTPASCFFVTSIPCLTNSTTHDYNPREVSIHHIPFLDALPFPCEILARELFNAWHRAFPK